MVPFCPAFAPAGSCWWKCKNSTKNDKKCCHADLLSNLELHHLVLLAIQDELRLQEQGAPNTPLKDINLDV